MLPRHISRTRVVALPLVVLLVAFLTFAGPPRPAAAAVACTTPNPGEVTVYGARSIDRRRMGRAREER